jgi:hypothetical protein
MDATTALRAARADGARIMRSLLFNGKRCDITSVRELRQRLLTGASLPSTNPISATPAMAISAEREPALREQDGLATTVPTSAAPPDTDTAESQPAAGAPGTRLRDRVWALVIAASVVASLIGLGLAMAVLL